MTRTPTEIATRWLSDFEAALSAQDYAALTGLFAEDSFWRDLIAFTWNIKTLEGREQIDAMLRARLADVAPSNFRIDGEATLADGVISTFYRFETRLGRGIGQLRLREGTAWTLLTTLRELKGHEEPRGPKRPVGAVHGARKHPRNWLDERNDELAALGTSTQPYVLIIGGGQGGIGLASRLRQLKVPALVIDKHERPGDAWRKRYHSLCLHDPIWYDHLPYVSFPENWPIFSPKDKIGDWLEMYVKVMEINYWGSSEATRASYDEAKQAWEVQVQRGDQTLTLRPKQLVLATGMSGVPTIPKYPGAETFRGQQHHSSKHPGGEGFAGKKAVVIGSNNSAHDIAADLWAYDADVTMLQRSSTHIVRSDSLMDVVLGPLYSEQAVQSGITTEIADLTFASIPYKILPQFHIPAFEQIAERDADFYAALTRAGFKLDFGDDGSGLFLKYLRRGSGYYIDVGASDLIIKGEVKLQSGQVSEITPDGVKLTDGTELPADVIVYATGYGSMNGWAAKIISQEVADKVGKCWGLGSDTTKDPGPWEGELRNMWKPTHQPALWFHGGNLHQSRHYSLYLALQLKARLEGIPTPVYGLQEVHHLS